MAHDSIDQLARRLAEALPQGVRNMREELEQNFRRILQTSLNRLDLVTREEFEVQQSVLARTREKLEGLEGRMSSLESGPPIEKTRVAKKKTSKKKPARAATKKTAKKKKKKRAKKT